MSIPTAEPIRTGAAAPGPPADEPPETILRGREPIRAELYGPERLEARARHVAQASAHVSRGPGHDLLSRCAQDDRILHAAHRRLTAAFAEGELITGEAEWLLDNFHIVADALREVRTDLPRGYYHKLPKLADDPLAGWPRVYWLALELVAHTDSALEEATLTRFVRAYQEVTPLTIGELWAVPIMLRQVLVENLSRLAQGMLDSQAIYLESHAQVRRFLSADDVAPVVGELLAPG